MSDAAVSGSSLIFLDGGGLWHRKLNVVVHLDRNMNELKCGGTNKIRNKERERH